MRSFVAALGRAHFTFNPLHSAIAEANELRHAIDTEALYPAPARIQSLIDRAGWSLSFSRSAALPDEN